MTAEFEPLPADLAAAVDAPAEARGPWTLRYLSETDSTNDVALDLALRGAPAGTAVLAGSQRAGRGRRGHSWFSPPGAGMYVSAIWRPAQDMTTMSLLTLAAGAAVADSVRTVSGLPVELKWPNDIVIGRPWRKLGGLLCEGAGTGSRIDAVVVGVGLNLRAATYPSDIVRTASSIEDELGRVVDRAALVIEILERLTQMAKAMEGSGGDMVRAAWRRFGAAGFGGAVRWRDQRGEHRGRAKDIDLDGALLVETSGRVERLVAGDVQWETHTRV